MRCVLAACRSRARFQSRAGSPRTPSRAAQDGCTALHLACAGGHRDAARLLLDKSDVDAEDSNGNTPVWAAFAAGQSDLARFLLEEGNADVNAACEGGKTYLHQAAQRKSVDDVAWLLAHKANKNAKDQYSDTPLHAAAAAGAWRIGRLLIDAGADVNARGKVRRSQQPPANCMTRHSRSPRTLPAAAVGPTFSARALAQNACTPLHVAALNPANAADRASFIELLLAKGSDPSALNKARLRTPSTLLLGG